MTTFSDGLSRALEGRYRIERELGRGGMATVYLAEDLKHHRKVALKVLKPELAAVVGADRFLAEIEVTAGLQHPHILPLFDSGESDSFLFYVMPWVEGESLRDRLQRRRQLPVDEAVRITTAVAQALDHAHRKGVVHRDIKPANILLQDDEPVVADFGIALAVGAAGGARLTETGLSLGTPYYMSPEQATGDQNVGPASDTYALACVLYEMLVGEPPYLGNTAQAVLGKIIAGAPVEPTAQRPSIPAHVDAAIRKGLEKLPADRFTTAQDFAEALKDPGFRHGEEHRVGPAGVAEARWRRRALALGAVAAVSLAVTSWALTRSPPPAPVTRFVVGMQGEEALWYTGSRNPPRLAITSDGARFVFTGWGSQRRPLLRVRALDQLSSVVLAGTEGATSPAISPGGDQVAFLGESSGGASSLAVLSLAGGAPLVLVESGVTAGPTWGGDDYVYFVGVDGRTLTRVPNVGGPVETVTTLDLGPEYSQYLDPVVVSDEVALVTAVATDDRTDVHFVDLGAGTSTFSVAGSGGRVTATGHFLYVTASGSTTDLPNVGARGSIMAQRYAPGAAAPEGRPTPVLDGIGLRRMGIVDLTLAANGTLLYTTENRDAAERMTWVDPDGSVEPVDPLWTDHLEVEALALSPDGNQVAMDMATADRADVWVKWLGEGAPRRLTFEGELNLRPVWSPDGSSIAYVSDRGDGLDAWVRPADGTGTPTLLLDHELDVFEVRWSPDGEWLLAVLEGASFDIAAAPASSPGSVEPILAGDRDEWEPVVSPDGRWLAYVSEETGRAEVFVVPFPEVASGKWQISTEGGREPRWSADGSELFVRHEDGSGMDVVDMSRGPSAPRRRQLFDFPPEEYFELNEENHLYDVGDDGRFVMIRAGQGDITGELVIVQNFLRIVNDLTGR